MITRYFRLFLVEPKFILRLVVFFFLAAVAIMQYQALVYQDKSVNQIILKKNQLAKLDELNQKLLAEKQKQVPLVQVVQAEPESTYLLEGSSVQNGKFHAVINGDVYKKGDPIDEFIVDTITMYSASLLNIRSGEIKVLQFAGPVIVPEE